MKATQTSNGDWVLSDGDQWLPGVFDSRDAALHAAAFHTDEDIQRLQDIANKRTGAAQGKITMADYEIQIPMAASRALHADCSGGRRGGKQRERLRRNNDT